MAKIKITLKKSPIGYNKKQRATAESLGLRKMQATVIQENTADIMGKINSIAHLVKWEPYVEESLPLAAKDTVETAEKAEEASQKKLRDLEAVEETVQQTKKADEIAEKEAPKRTPKKKLPAETFNEELTAKSEPLEDSPKPVTNDNALEEATTESKSSDTVAVKRTPGRAKHKGAGSVADMVAGALNDDLKRVAEIEVEAVSPEKQE